MKRRLCSLVVGAVALVALSGSALSQDAQDAAPAAVMDAAPAAVMDAAPAASPALPAPLPDEPTGAVEAIKTGTDAAVAFKAGKIYSGATLVLLLLVAMLRFLFSTFTSWFERSKGRKYALVIAVATGQSFYIVMSDMLAWNWMIPVLALISLLSSGKLADVLPIPKPKAK